MTAEHREVGVAQVRCRAASFEAKWSLTYPSAVALSEPRIRDAHHPSSLVPRALGPDPPQQPDQAYLRPISQAEIMSRLPGQHCCFPLVRVEPTSRGWRSVDVHPADRDCSNRSAATSSTRKRPKIPNPNPPNLTRPKLLQQPRKIMLGATFL